MVNKEEYLKKFSDCNNLEDFLLNFVEFTKIFLNSKAICILQKNDNNFVIKYSDSSNKHLEAVEAKNTEEIEPFLSSSELYKKLDAPITNAFQDEKYYLLRLDDTNILCIIQDAELNDNDTKILQLLAIIFNLNCKSQNNTAPVDKICNLIDKNFSMYVSTLQSIIGSIVFLKNEITGLHLQDLINNIYNQCYGILLSLNEHKEFQKNLFSDIEKNIVDVNIKQVLDNFSNYFINKIKDKKFEFRYNNLVDNTIIKSDQQKINFIIEKLLGFVVRYSNSSVIDIDFISNNGQISQIDISAEGFTLSQSVLNDIFLPDTINVTYDGKFIALTNFSFPIISYYLEALNHSIKFKLKENNKLIVSFNFYDKFSAPFKKVVSFVETTSYKIAPETHSGQIASVTTTQPEKPKYKILLAEDYKHSQIIVTRLLKKNGYEDVVTVENGQEAVDAAKNNHFHLILMDMQMPVKSGFEAIQEIREMENYKDIPIIALTAFAMKGDKEKCIEAGATDYIPKPIDSKELLEKIALYLNK